MDPKLWEESENIIRELGCSQEQFLNLCWGSLPYDSHKWKSIGKNQAIITHVRKPWVKHLKRIYEESLTKPTTIRKKFPRPSRDRYEYEFKKL